MKTQDDRDEYHRNYYQKHKIKKQAYNYMYYRIYAKQRKIDRACARLALKKWCGQDKKPIKLFIINNL